MLLLLFYPLSDWSLPVFGFGVPASTPYDLRFSLFGIPVRVHPLFWLLALLIGMNLPPKWLPLWVAVVFVSILVHEMGHALVIRSFGWQPKIVLWSFGGLAIYQPTRHDSRKQMTISLAGPIAGFILAALVVLALRATGIQVVFERGMPSLLTWKFILVNPAAAPSGTVMIAADFLLEVNIWWGLLNLLPIVPLDGGQFTREMLTDLRIPDPEVKSLVLSIIVAAGMGIFVYSQSRDIFMAMWFGYFAYNSYAMLQQFTGRGGGYGGW